MAEPIYYADNGTRANAARNALGLAMRAGKVVSGELAVEKAMKSGNVKLVVMDAGASENTVKRWKDACRHRKLPLAAMEEMGHAIGKDARIVAAVTDEGFSAMLLKNCNEINAD